MMSWCSRRLAAAFVLACAAPFSAQAITVQEVQGPSGVETWLSEEHALPMIAIDIALPAGSAYDPAGKLGLSALMTSLLDEGAGDLAAVAFKEALESRAIRLSAQSDRDDVVVTLTTLSANAAEAFRLLGLALQRPRFDAEAVERMRALLLADLRQKQEEPRQVASRAWFAAYFGNHPYAHPTDGTEAGLTAITVDDIKAFAASHLVRDRIKVAVAGDITEAQLKAYLDTVFAPLPAKAVPPVPPPATTGKPGTEIIQRAETAPVAVFGLAGPMRADPDFIPTFVANQILGGGTFSARLMDQVRDKRGLTYGISTALDDFRSAAIIVGQVQSEKAKILTALEVTKQEMARFASEGATMAELADAKTYLTGSFPLSFDSNAKIARALNGFQRAGLAADYIEKRNGLIEAVTLDAVNAMAKKYYDPSKLVVVIAGTPDPAPAAAK